MTDALPDIEKPRAPHAGARAIEIDLYCLECGYNLRGLSGDPVRCPECGYRNPIGDVLIPADQIRKQLKKMENAPAYSLLALLFMLPAFLATGGLLLSGHVRDAHYPALAATVATMVWVGAMSRFRSSCEQRPGWLAALLRYQLVGLALIGIVITIFCYGTYLLDHSGRRLNRYFGESWPCVALPLMFAVVFVGIVWGLRPVHRWLRAPMDKLQRQVAVKIARERIRKEMRNQPRWWKSR